VVTDLSAETAHIGRVPAYQALADRLRKQITSGALRPGDRLPTEPQLCERTGVSRSTVREALRLLASQNLIVTTRGVTGGSFVAEPNPTQLGEMLSTGLTMLMAAGTVSTRQWFEVRETFEVPAAGLAARRRTEAQLAGLADKLFDPDRTPVETMVAAHMAFHVRLAEATGNPLYELITRPLYTVANEQALGDGAPAGFWRQVDTEHRVMLRAIAAKDQAAARAAARTHLEHVREAYSEGDVRVALS
jgi:GntR family transcriptional regulator, transcriptional repressor for pyruvate dehydrogenase complex